MNTREWLDIQKRNPGNADVAALLADIDKRIEENASLSRRVERLEEGMKKLLADDNKHEFDRLMGSLPKCHLCGKPCNESGQIHNRCAELENAMS